MGANCLLRFHMPRSVGSLRQYIQHAHSPPAIFLGLVLDNFRNTSMACCDIFSTAYSVYDGNGNRKLHSPHATRERVDIIPLLVPIYTVARAIVQQMFAQRTHDLLNQAIHTARLKSPLSAPPTRMKLFSVVSPGIWVSIGTMTARYA